MISTSADLALSRVRRLALGLLLLAVPACGLSDYEERMGQAQRREERFLEEQKYLDRPVRIPRVKNAKGRKVAVANVFFRPPKGIQSKSRPEPRNELMWHYPAARRGGSLFVSVEMAFAEKDDKDFTTKVVESYTTTEQQQPRRKRMEIRALDREEPMVFESWEFASESDAYSINFLQGHRKQVAIVFIYKKAQRANVRKAIQISLQSLAVDQEVGAALQRYNLSSPWRLENEDDDS